MTGVLSFFWRSASGFSFFLSFDTLRLKLMRIARALALLFLLFAPVISQTADDVHREVRAAYASGRYSDALSRLRAFEREHAEEFRSNNYDYLAGRAAENAGDTSAATAFYLAL